MTPGLVVAWHFRRHVGFPVRATSGPSSGRPLPCSYGMSIGWISLKYQPIVATTAHFPMPFRSKFAVNSLPSGNSTSRAICHGTDREDAGYRTAALRDARRHNPLERPPSHPIPRNPGKSRLIRVPPPAIARTIIAVIEQTTMSSLGEFFERFGPNATRRDSCSTVHRVDGDMTTHCRWECAATRGIVEPPS